MLPGLRLSQLLHLSVENGISIKFPQKGWCRSMAPTHPHGQIENATAPSAGVLSIRTGNNTFLLYGTKGTGAEVSLIFARRKKMKRG